MLRKEALVGAWLTGLAAVAGGVISVAAGGRGQQEDRDHHTRTGTTLSLPHTVKRTHGHVQRVVGFI